MLNPELAQAQLKEIKNAQWQSQRLQAIGALPKQLQAIGYAMFQRDDAGQPAASTQEANQLIQQRLEELDQLSAQQRTTIFGAIFPQFAAQVEAGWQLSKTLPYQGGYLRQSFRLPQHPELTFENRWDWLRTLINVLDGYDRDLAWLVDWTPYLGWYADRCLGILFAATIDQGGAQGQETLQLLMDSAQGNREIGAMGRHVVRALLTANNPTGWEFIEKLLLAAQRQEGLRQSILEAVDEAHPIAYQRMLRLIIDENLIRFSATIRAAAVWFGFDLEVFNEKQARQIIAQVWELLTVPEAPVAALQSNDAQTVYLALWQTGFGDAMAAIPIAQKLLKHEQPSHRYVAVKFLQQLALHAAKLAVLPAINDQHQNIAALAVQTITNPEKDLLAEAPDTFERLQTILDRFPAKAQVLPPLVWEWEKLTASQSLVVNALLNWLGDRSAKLMIPYLSLLEPYDRLKVARLLAGYHLWIDAAAREQVMASWDAETRSQLLKMLGDSSSTVREGVLDILKKYQVAPTEIISLEALLTRKASDLRRGLIQLLLNQASDVAIGSAERLLAGKDLQQQAGLELLRELGQQQAQSPEIVAACRSVAVAYQDSHKTLTPTAAQLVAGILDAAKTPDTLTNALGLVDPANLTPVARPQVMQPVQLDSPASRHCLLAIDELVHQHRQTPVTIENWHGAEEALLGNLSWQFPHYSPDLSPAENLQRLPLADVWENWWRDRGADCRDTDGLELWRASSPKYHEEEWWSMMGNETDEAVEENQVSLSPEEMTTGLDYIESLSQAMRSGGAPAEQYERAQALAKQVGIQVKQQILALVGEQEELRYPEIVGSILRWLLLFHPIERASDVYLDGLSTILLTIPQRIHHVFFAGTQSAIGHGLGDLIGSWVGNCRQEMANFSPPNMTRWWHLTTWVEQLNLNYSYNSVELYDLYQAYLAGGATEDDVIYYLLGEQSLDLVEFQSFQPRRHFSELSNLTRRKSVAPLYEIPILQQLTDRCRQRVLEVELQRGELPTAASHAALSLRSITGMNLAIQILQALDRGNLLRGSNYGNLSKSAVFSHLMQISFPAATDMPGEFAKEIRASQISEEKLIQFAFYAPQWLQYVEQALGWPGFADGVWWIHGHTKDNQWSVDADIRETWVAQIAERTPLSATDLVDGAVDVSWFQQVYQLLGADRWQQLEESAKYAASGSGHQRAKLFAQAMLGRVERQELIDRITKKRHQDALRALGLLPLAAGNKRDGDILSRYQILQEFLRGSKKFGSQRQASEKLAVTIGMDNLARTAGYRDPQRLQWAMEAQAVADLAGQAQVVTVGEVSVSLSIDQAGDPSISVVKAGKALKAVPANLKKNPEIKALVDHKQEITRQASRMRISLEQAMTRGDALAVSELPQLVSHPVLWPMLSQLVLVGNGEMGYLTRDGKSLESLDNRLTEIQSQELRIAHPHDLLTSTAWEQWQKECFDREQAQPFKQLFRELYVPTAAERQEKISKRYEGHQINPRQAIALFGQRGWVSMPQEGLRRTFHQEGIVAEVEFVNGFSTPLEVEGLTIYGVRFYPRDKWEPMPIQDVPAILFSETMRDLDLVVSVAHVGGVDPEASASTVEMRSTILRETCRLMKLSNVQLQSSHCLINGHLGDYSVHLGSGVVHRQPGGSLCILPVSSQHRGRLFLPFVDDDPKTAEILSKVLLLAKDQDIKDPTILEQLL